MDLSDRASKTDDHYRNKSILMPDHVYVPKPFPSIYSILTVTLATYFSPHPDVSITDSKS